MTIVYGFYFDQVVSFLVNDRRDRDRDRDSDGVSVDDCKRHSTAECFQRD